MEKITMGRTRKKSKIPDSGRTADQAKQTKSADAVFVFGAAAVCVMLAAPMLGLNAGTAEPSLPKFEEAAVTVMSGGVEPSPDPLKTAETAEKEELFAPSNAKTEEWSFYDYIGELFAGLLSGQ